MVLAKVLIVDDAKVTRINLAKMFAELGFEIAGEATNGQEAYDEYKKLKPDLVTMDVTMPVMDGLEATKKIYDEFDDAKIIICSSHSQRETMIEAIENGASHYLLKPVKIDILKNALSKLI
jgi:two-component system chemotaxis response regulator CheY